MPLLQEKGHRTVECLATLDKETTKSPSTSALEGRGSNNISRNIQHKEHKKFIPRHKPQRLWKYTGPIYPPTKGKAVSICCNLRLGSGGAGEVIKHHWGSLLGARKPDKEQNSRKLASYIGQICPLSMEVGGEGKVLLVKFPSKEGLLLVIGRTSVPCRDYKAGFTVY